jgi:hypothetical protein
MTPTWTLRGLQVGDIGWVTHRQGILYAQEYGWDGTFEALVAEIAAQFVKNFDAACENAWIAEIERQNWDLALQPASTIDPQPLN